MLLWASLAALAAPWSWGEVADGIHVDGRGTLEVAPDMGYVRLHARREGMDAGRLKEELDTVVAAVLKLARDLGIRPEDVTATALSISPRYQRRNNETVVEGLIASRTVSLTLRRLDRYGELMNRALAAGVNNVDPISMDTSRREALENEALEIAMRDAIEEAGRVAAGFSVKVGQLVDVQLGMHSPRPELAARVSMAQADGGDFSPGQIRIERTLQATFAILPD